MGEGRDEGDTPHLSALGGLPQGARKPFNEGFLKLAGFARKYTSLTETVILSPPEADEGSKKPAFGYFSESDAPLFRFFVASLLRMTFIGQGPVYIKSWC